MSNIQVFNHEIFGNLRAIVVDGEPWFVAADVCKSLDITNPTMALERLDGDEKAKFNLGLSGGDTNMVSFPGMLALILGSRKPEAKAYKRWATHEVLPSIHKTGGYIVGQESLTGDELLAKAVLFAQNKINEQATLIHRMEPKAVFANAVSTSDTTILIGELAKLLRQNGIEIGEKRLFGWLRENGYLIRRKGTDYNAPTQRAMEMGLFRVKETAITHSDGHVTVSKTTKVTGKGQQYFINMFLGKQVELVY